MQTDLRRLKQEFNLKITNGRIMKSKLMSKISITAAISTAYIILNFVYNAWYCLGCEKYYGIPRQYFSVSINDNLLYVGLLTLVVWACFFSPKYVRKIGNSVWDKLAYGVCVVLYGLFFWLVNWTVLEITSRNLSSKDNPVGEICSWIIDNELISLRIIFAISMMAVVGYSLLDVISHKMPKYFDCIRFFIMAIFALSMCIPVIGIIGKMTTSEEDRRRYEFISCDDKEYVVLSEYNNEVLAVPYLLDSENMQYVFKTEEYRFIQRTEGKFRYIDIGNKPVI